MHKEENLIHRDVKMGNILINKNVCIKICDFGLSKKLNEGEYATENVGTR